MLRVRNRKWVSLFIAILVIVLAQVGWWTAVFLDDVNIITQIKEENLVLKSQTQTADLDLAGERAKLQDSAMRRRVMFISESFTFVVLSCFGLYLLFYALRSEAHSKEIEKNFVQVVSHESKTPITAMKLRLESLLEKKSEDPDVSKEIPQVLEEVRRLASIFDKAMGVHRLERERMRFETVDLGEVVREVLRRMDPLFRAHQVTLRFPAPPAANVSADPHGVETAIQCLIENAILHNPKSEKSVEVNLSAPGARVRLVISDNGTGVMPEERDNLFERFYRGKKRRGEAPVAGTGLGLYIARTIVRAHQGELTFEPSNEGGASFVMEFPKV